MKLVLGVVLFSIVVGCSIGWILYEKNKMSALNIEVPYYTNQPNPKVLKQTEKHWLDSAKDLDSNNVYPAQEFEVFIDFIDSSKQNVAKKLLIQAITKDEYMCLSEVLKEKNINFAYNNNQNHIDIIIYLPNDFKTSQNLMKELSYYDIAYIQK